MRIRGAKTQLEEAGLETDGMVESTAKLRSEIMALTGVDIMDGANQFKSTYKIMEELAGKWKDLSDIQQATVTELIAGKRQGNIVSSLMNNFDIAEKALETSMNSAGSAMREHEKWQQSLEAQILKLKAAWQGLSQAFLSSDFLKAALNGIIGLVDGLTKLIDTIGTVPTLLAGFVGFKSLKTILSALSKGGSLKEFGSILGVLKDAFPYVTKGVGKLVSSLKEVSLKAGGASSAFGGFLSLIMQHPYIAVATVAITALTGALMYQKKKAEELSKEVDELTSKYQEEHKALRDVKSDYDTSNESSMISKYAKLSKGVDNLGRNVSLTADEYSEYQSIVSTIADQIPSLVSGYDAQGNALLSCKGNVEELTKAYEKLIHAQNQEILTNTGNIEKDFENTLEKASGKHWWSNGHGFWAGALNSGMFVTGGQLFGSLLDYELKNDTVQGIQDLMNASNKSEKNKIINKLKADQYSADEIRDALTGADIDVGVFESPIDVLEETLEKDPSKIKGIIDNYYEQFAEAVEQQKTIAQAKLSEAFDVSSVISGLNYGNISEELQAVARQTVNSLDYEFFAELQEEGKTVEEWTNELLKQLNNISKTDNAEIESAFNLETQFNGGEISYGEYVDNLKNVKKTIDGLKLKDEAKQQLKISLGLDNNGVIKEYNALVKLLSNDNILTRLTGKKKYDFDITKDEAEKFLSSLSAEELSVAVDVITEMSDNGVEETIEEIRNAIDRELAIQGLTLELDIEVEKTKLEALTTALTESFSGSGLSSDSITAVEGMFGDLSGYDPSKLFERTANGIKLNNTELRRLNSESKKTNIAKINKEMDSLGDIYNQTREELYRLTYGTDEYNDKAKELSDIEARIKSLEQLSSQYKGLASAYQEWQMAESTGSQRDMYETILEGWENVGDEISRGWVDDGTREFFELLKGEKATIVDGNGVAKEINIATASAKELKQVWKDLDKNIEHTSYSVRDFFTVDEDGNSTSQGVYNFLDAIGQMEEEKFGGKDVVKRDDKGNVIGFDFQMVGGDKVIAEALGVSEELVQIMKRAAVDAGFVVTFDGSFEQLDVLREKAQKAAEEMNKILKEDGKATIDIDMNVDSVEDIQPQLDKIIEVFGEKDGNGKLTGAINMDIKGADQAIQIASTLQSMKDKLTRPAYMDIQISQVDEELREPLQNLQDYRTKIEQLNQAKLRGADTTELEESIEESKEKVIADLIEIQESNPELAAELDIKGLSKEELEKKVEAGEIKIPATVDIQLEMDEKLGILADKALLDAGIITEEEFKKRVNVYLEADVDNDDAKDKTENAVDEVTGEEKRKQNIEIIAKTFGVEDVEGLSSKLEGLDDKTIQAIAEVLGQVDVDSLKLALSGMSDVQVQAIAEAIGKGDVEGLQSVISGLDSNTVQAIAQAFGYSDVNELNTAIENLDTKVVQAIAQALGLGDVNTLQTTVNNMQGNTVDAKVNTDGQSAKIDVLQSSIFGLQGTTVDVVVNFVKSGFNAVKNWLTGGGKGDEGGSDVNGTANVNGTTGKAFKQGDWRTKKTETALTGELGREIVVTPQNRWYTVGDNGAEFVNIPRGSIIFNHRQTEELLKNGKATSDGGRAKALVSGTAFLSGTAHRGEGEWIAPEVKSFTIGYDYSSSKNSDKSQEIFDWIEVAIERIERSIDRLDQKANNIYKNWSTRNSALASEIGEVRNEIALQQKAYEGYMSAANQVGLSSEWAKKVQSGAIDIDNVTDEKLANKIKDYQKW